MTWASTLPTVSTALVAALDGVLPAGTVRKGPRVGPGSAEAVTVRFQTEDTPTANGRFSAEGMGVAPSREQYTIGCAATVRKGAGDVDAATSRAFELLAAVGAALAADPTIGGAVLSARLGEWELSETQGAKTGATAVLLFDVDIDAFTAR